jgi:hypothetical protein
MQITIYNTLKSRLETIDIEFTDSNTTWCGDYEDAPDICRLTELNGGLLISRFDNTYPVWEDITKEQWLQGLPPPESRDHQMRLCQLESMIATHNKNFYTIGKALKEIRDQRLYRQLYFDTFEDYTNNRWDMGKSHAYRLIHACQVLDNLSPIGEKLPRNEAQARPLSKLDAFNQRKLWRQFLKSNLELKARNIAKFVSAYMRTDNGCEQAQLIEIISADYKQAVMAMLYQIRVAQNDHWQSTSQQAALYWNQVIREKILWKF